MAFAGLANKLNRAEIEREKLKRKERQYLLCYSCFAIPLGISAIVTGISDYDDDIMYCAKVSKFLLIAGSVCLGSVVLQLFIHCTYVMAIFNTSINLTNPNAGLPVCLVHCSICLAFIFNGFSIGWTIYGMMIIFGKHGDVQECNTQMTLYGEVYCILHICLATIYCCYHGCHPVFHAAAYESYV